MFCFYSVHEKSINIIEWIMYLLYFNDLSKSKWTNCNYVRLCFSYILIFELVFFLKSICFYSGFVETLAKHVPQKRKSYLSQSATLTVSLILIM